jgi:magnesium-transporting ATPase (P-type)
MTQDGQAPDKDRAQRALNMALAGIVGQVGCLTLVIIAVALIAGLWLDSRFHTRPLFALILVLGSVPVTLYLMFRIVLAFAPRIEAYTAGANASKTEEETEGGERRPDNS